MYSGEKPASGRLFDHADVGQAAETVSPVQAVADEEFVARFEAGEVGLELGAPLVRLVEQGVFRRLMARMKNKQHIQLF